MGEAAKLFTRSLMMGLDSAVRKNEFAELTAEDVENLPYVEAVEYLKKRDVIKKVDYNKLSDKMRFRAFTASRIADGDLLKRINSELIKNVNDGKGLKDFLFLTKTDILNKVGMGAGGQGWYWETVYRTNVQTAYNTGRMIGFEEDKPLALHFVGIEDARQTDVCHSLSNVIRPYDDPLWEKYIPPLHFGCRSTVRAIYDEDELPEDWSSLEGIEKPAKGFGTNPLENDSWWNELSSQVARAKEYGVQGEIEAARIALGVNNQPVGNDYSLAPDIKNFEQTDILNRYMERVPKDGNYFDVALHGTPTEVKYNGELISARQLAKIIRHNKDFSRQNGVRLLSCSTGKGDDCFAQNLANALGCEVKAPCDVLRVSPSGNLFVDGNAGWKIFSPNMNGRRK